MSTTTKAQLQAFLARDEMEGLIRQLQVLCLREPHNQLGNELILLVSQYNDFVEKEARMYAADREVALAKVKGSLQDFIQLLDLPAGNAADLELLYKRPQDRWQAIVASPWRWSILIFSVCLVLIALGQIRVRSTVFYLEAKVHKLGLRPAQNWNIGANYDLFLKKLELEYATQINVVPELRSVESFVSIQQGRIQLNALPILRGQGLTLVQDKAEVILSLVEGSPRLEADLMSAHLFVQELGTEFEFGDPSTGEETVKIQSSKAAKIWLSACDTCAFTLPDLYVDSLDFTYRRDTQIVSGIERAQLQIGNQTYSLQKEDWLGLEQLKEARLQIQPGVGAFSIDLQGKAEQIRSRNALGKSQNLMPTYLQYFRQNQGFLFYFSAISALFAMLFPLREWFKKK